MQVLNSTEVEQVSGGIVCTIVGTVVGVGVGAVVGVAVGAVVGGAVVGTVGAIAVGSVIRYQRVQDEENIIPTARSVWKKYRPW